MPITISPEAVNELKKLVLTCAAVIPTLESPRAAESLRAATKALVQVINSAEADNRARVISK